MQPADRNPIAKGSPAKEPCSHIGLSGTADEQSAAKKINTADDAGKNIRAGPVPLFLVPQTLSAEIHAHSGDISEITVRRTRHHVYAISLTKTPKENHKQGCKQVSNQSSKQDRNQSPNQGREQSHKQNRNQSPNQGREQSNNPGGADAD